SPRGGTALEPERPPNSRPCSKAPTPSVCCAWPSGRMPSRARCPDSRSTATGRVSTPTSAISRSTVTATATGHLIRPSTASAAAPGFATKGDKNVPVMALTMNVRNPTGVGIVNSAIWNHLRIDRGNPNGFNQARDVDAIHLYYDYDNNGLFDITKDSEVTSTSKAYNFPQTTLKVAMDASTDVVNAIDLPS